MIRIVKPAAPAKLQEGDALTLANCATFDGNPAPYEAGTLNFAITSTIYGHAKVKERLRTAQHSKCCFCEGMFEANAAADVEHFRPKKYSQQGRGQPAAFPGYYWLGYAWRNLYYSCQVCNRSYKKNFFPLRHPANRVRNHHGDVAIEAPLILDPSGTENPRDHIKFRGDVAVGVSDEGIATVNYCGLNRPALIEARLERFQQLQQLKDLVKLLAADPEPAKQALAVRAQNKLIELSGPTAKFSAMTSDYVDGTGLP